MKTTMTTLAAFVVMTGFTSPISAEFTEQFNGQFDHLWFSNIDSFPDESIWVAPQASIGTVSYVGSPAGAFFNVGSDETFRMTNTLAPLTRVGMVSEQDFYVGSGFVEARINTLTQDELRIDQFVDLWLLNSVDPTQYVRVGLFGSSFSEDRGWSFSTSIDGSTFQSGVDYSNDTWYRVRIDMDELGLGVSILDDVSGVPIVQHDFSHTLSALGPNFRIGLAQFMGTPGGQLFVTDVAIDFVTTSLLPVPEPTSLFLVTIGLLAFAGVSHRRR